MVPIDAELRAFVRSYRKRHALAHAYVREHRIRIDYGPGPRDDAVVRVEASVRRYYADQLCGPPGARPAARLAKFVLSG
jgi:hypothetical protein